MCYEYKTRTRIGSLRNKEFIIRDLSRDNLPNILTSARITKPPSQIKMLREFDITNARYSVLYLPAFSYGCSYLEQGSISYLFFEVSAIWLSAVALIGAIIVNSVFRSIYEM